MSLNVFIKSQIAVLKVEIKVLSLYADTSIELSYKTAALAELERQLVYAESGKDPFDV